MASIQQTSRDESRPCGHQGPYLMQGDDEEGPPTSAFSDHSDEVGVHGTEVVVMDAACDGHRVITVLFAGRLAVDMAELGAAILGVP